MNIKITIRGENLQENLYFLRIFWVESCAQYMTSIQLEIEIVDLEKKPVSSLNNPIPPPPPIQY